MNVLIKFRKSIMLLIKILIIASLLFGFISIWQTYYTSSKAGFESGAVVVLSYVAIYITFIQLYGGFLIGINRLHEIIYSQVLAITFTNFIMYLELSLLIGQLQTIPPIFVGIAFQILFASVGVYCANTVYFKLYPARRSIAIFGDDEEGTNLIIKMSKIPERFSIQCGVSVRNRTLEEIKRLINDYEAVIISDIEKNMRNEILKYCYADHKRVYILPTSTDIILNNCYNIQISDIPILMCKGRGLTNEQEIIKRTFDILLSLFGIIIASPIMLIIAISIKICDGGPILFKQNRVTKDGKIFNVLKFRSMIVDADKDGAQRAVDNDKRITPVGKIIRPVRLDELPQLFNILFGSMSFVGPRPERIENVYEYTQKFPDFKFRNKVKAGLTGYAQIYGKYNTSPENKLKMDLIYIEHYSLLQDIKLLAMTVKILFMKESTEGFESGKEGNGTSK